MYYVFCTIYSGTMVVTDMFPVLQMCILPYPRVSDLRTVPVSCLCTVRMYVALEGRPGNYSDCNQILITLFMKRWKLYVKKKLRLDE